MSNHKQHSIPLTVLGWRQKSQANVFIVVLSGHI